MPSLVETVLPSDLPFSCPCTAVLVVLVVLASVREADPLAEQEGGPGSVATVRARPSSRRLVIGFSLPAQHAKIEVVIVAAGDLARGHGCGAARLAGPKLTRPDRPLALLQRVVVRLEDVGEAHAHDVLCGETLLLGALLVRDLLPLLPDVGHVGLAVQERLLRRGLVDLGVGVGVCV